MKKPYGRVERTAGGGRRSGSATRDGDRSGGARRAGGPHSSYRDRDGERGGGRSTGAEVADGGNRRRASANVRSVGRRDEKGRPGREERSRGQRDSRREGREAEVVTPSEDIVCGRHPVIEALKSGRPINKIIIADTSVGGSLTEIIGKAKAAGIIIQSAPKAHLTKVAGEGHQGVIAYVAPHAYAELEDIVQRKTGQASLIVLLDEVTDPYNLGAVLRTAEATGVQGIVIPKRRAVPLTGVVAKVAAGALEYVPVARVTNLVQAMERLKELGYWIVGTAVDGKQKFTQVDYTGNMAIVIGAEGKGLSRLVQEKCDFLVRMPMLGKLQSLNASVAAGVLLYEVVRQRS